MLNNVSLMGNQSLLFSPPDEFTQTKSISSNAICFDFQSTTKPQINHLLHRKSSSPLPSCTSASSLADSLATFFTEKISRTD